MDTDRVSTPQQPASTRVRIYGTAYDRCTCGRLKREQSPHCAKCKSRAANGAFVGKEGIVRAPETALTGSAIRLTWCKPCQNGAHEEHRETWLGVRSVLHKCLCPQHVAVSR